MKRTALLGVASTAAALGLVAGVTTSALLMDGDDDRGNELTAGTLELFGSPRQGESAASCSAADLAADDWGATFTLPTFGGMRPGDNRSTVVCIKNGGTIDGAVTLQANNVKDLENTCIDPEGEAGDVTCAALQGELTDQLRVGIATYPPTGASCAATPSPVRWVGFSQLQVGIDLVPLSAQTRQCVSFTVDWPASPDAVGQLDRDRANGDAAEFDLLWTLSQVV